MPLQGKAFILEDLNLPCGRHWTHAQGVAFVGNNEQMSYAEFYRHILSYRRQLRTAHWQQMRTVFPLRQDAKHVALLWALLEENNSPLLYPPGEPLISEIIRSFEPHGTTYLTVDGRLQIFSHDTGLHPEPNRRLVFLTGGTGGRPRLACFDPQPFLQQYERPSKYLVALPLMPFFHFGGFDLLMRTLGRQGTVKVIPLVSDRINKALLDDPVPHVVSATPTFWHWLLNSGLQPPYHRIQRINLGGEAPWDELMERIQKAFPDAEIVNTWAATETGLLRSHQVRIKNGEVWARPQAGFVGYWRQPLELDQEGFFRTGDRGRIDESGHLVYQGRIDDMIKVQGHAVSKRRIEEAILAHPSVGWTKIETQKHPLIGTYLLAKVAPMPKQTIDRSTLVKFLRQRLFSYEIPTRIEIYPTPRFRSNLKR